VTALHRHVFRWGRVHTLCKGYKDPDEAMKLVAGDLDVTYVEGNLWDWVQHSSDEYTAVLYRTYYIDSHRGQTRRWWYSSTGHVGLGLCITAQISRKAGI
jgi:hypothetical protein